jgi:hypothetical protein
MKADTKDPSLMSIDSSRYKKWDNFYILQRVSDSLTGTKDRLPADTINIFYSSGLWYKNILRHKML